jgi:hypothetical protein
MVLEKPLESSACVVLKMIMELSFRIGLILLFQKSETMSALFVNRFVNEIFGNLFHETFGRKRYFF